MFATGLIFALSLSTLAFLRHDIAFDSRIRALEASATDRLRESTQLARQALESVERLKRGMKPEPDEQLNEQLNEQLIEQPDEQPNEQLNEELDEQLNVQGE